jgi:hypothetical protein
MKPEWIPVIHGDHDVSLFDPKAHKMVCPPIVFYHNYCRDCEFKFHQDVSVETSGGAALAGSDEFSGFTFVEPSSALDAQAPGVPSEGRHGDA